MILKEQGSPYQLTDYHRAVDARLTPDDANLFLDLMWQPLGSYTAADIKAYTRLVTQAREGGFDFEELARSRQSQLELERNR